MRYLCFVSVLVLVVNVDNAKVNRKLLLTVFYESNDFPSKTFVLRQLVPAVQLLKDHITVKFVPFGIAQSIDYSMSGFECRHGPSECYANMVQDCALDQMRVRGVQDTEKAAYVACEMDSWAASMGSMMCVRNATGVDPMKVIECLTTDKGNVLQLDSEYFTSLVKPQVIPTVTLNGNFNQKFQNNALVDLIGALCLHLANAPPCARHYNSQALAQVLGASPLRPRFPFYHRLGGY